MMCQQEYWRGRRLVCPTASATASLLHLRRRLALWVPMAGYGMNACIAYAMTSWQLAATLKGMCDPPPFSMPWRPNEKKKGHPLAVSAILHAPSSPLKKRSAASVPDNSTSRVRMATRVRARFGRMLYS